MIPVSIKELYGNQINFLHKIGASPLIWDFKTEKLVLSNNPKWFSSVIALVAYISYVGFRLVSASDISHTEYNLLVVMFSLNLYVHTFQIFLIFRANDVIVCVNSSLKYYSEFKNKFGKGGAAGKEESKSIGVFVAKTFITVIFHTVKVAAITWGLIGTFQPYELIAPPSLLPDELKINKMFNLIFPPLYGLVIMWLGITCGGQMIVTANSLVLVAIGYSICEAQLRVGKPNYWTKGWLRTPMNLRKTIDSLAIIVGLFHNAAQDFLMNVQMMMTRIVHLCCYLLIRHHNEMKTALIFIITGMMMAFMISVLGFMQGAAIIHTTSNKTVRSWRKCVVISQRERTIWQKIRKSIKPLGIKVGSCFIVKPITVVTIAENYFKGTIRLLLTFKKKR